MGDVVESTAEGSWAASVALVVDVPQGAPRGLVELHGSNQTPGGRLSHQYTILVARDLTGTPGSFEDVSSTATRYVWIAVPHGITGLANHPGGWPKIELAIKSIP